MVKIHPLLHFNHFVTELHDFRPNFLGGIFESNKHYGNLAYPHFCQQAVNKTGEGCRLVMDEQAADGIHKNAFLPADFLDCSR